VTKSSPSHRQQNRNAWECIYDLLSQVRSLQAQMDGNKFECGSDVPKMSRPGCRAEGEIMNLLQLGLDAQAMSIGKGPKEFAAAQVDSSALESPTLSRGHEPASAADHAENKPDRQPLDYSEPIPKVCPSCGTKYWGFSCPRSACKE
jgi:hypothetical protein